MKIETVDIDSVHFDPANARKHPQRNLDVITSSLVRFGQQKPLVVNEQNIVLAGNGTLAAARGLGWKQIQIVRSDLIGFDATSFAIVDNRSAELAQWDPDILAAALLDNKLGDIGFTDTEINEWLGEQHQDLQPDLSSDLGSDSRDTSSQEIDSRFEVVISCENVEEQKTLYKRMSAEGFTCRLLTL